MFLLVAVGKVANLESVDVIVAVLEDVVAKVTSTSVAVIIVATPEVVGIKAEVLPVAY